VESALATLLLGGVIQPVSSRLPVAERAAIADLADSRVVIGAEPGSHGARLCVPVPPTSDDETPLPLLISEPWRATTSGGSTGRPKLIVGVGPAIVPDLDSPDYLLPAAGTVFIPGPLYHGAPFLIGLAAILHGNHLILAERFDAAETLEVIERQQVNYLLLVPTMMHRIWRLPEEIRDRTDISSLQTVCTPRRPVRNGSSAPGSTGSGRPMSTSCTALPTPPTAPSSGATSGWPGPAPSAGPNRASSRSPTRTAIRYLRARWARSGCARRRAGRHVPTSWAPTRVSATTGPRSVTSDGSTRRATCSSPTAAPT
jgi:hypothetical protein